MRLPQAAAFLCRLLFGQRNFCSAVVAERIVYFHALAVVIDHHRGGSYRAAGKFYPARGYVHAVLLAVSFERLVRYDKFAVTVRLDGYKKREVIH